MDINGSDFLDEAEQHYEERVKKLVPLAKDVVQVLVKTIKATRMYLPNNPIYQKFYDELSEKLLRFFDEEDLLSIMVDRFELTFMGQQIYQNPDKDDNLALMFFKDGIREFSFHRGITPEEVHGFIDILKTDTKDIELDDDLVTLLWERDFSNVTYTVTEESMEDEADEEEALLTFEDEPEALRELDSLRAKAVEPVPAGERGGAYQAGASGAALPEAGVFDAGGAFPVEDHESIRGSFKAPDDLSLLTELSDIFYEILVTEKDNELFDIVTESLTKALEIFVKRGDLALATILVMKVQELAARPDLAEREGKLNRFLERARSEALVGMVGGFMDQGGPEAMESAGSYLLQLDINAAKSVASLFESLQNRKARKAVADILAGICGGNGKSLTEFLGHRYWYVARNIAMVLCKVADPDTVPALGMALKNPEPRVRREVIHALGVLHTERSDGFLAESIGDTDRHNRALAARLLTERAPAKAFEKLLSIISDKKFPDKESDEMREVFELLGRAGREKAVPALNKWFQARGFLVGKLYEKSRACSAYGLAATGVPEAEAMLREGANSKSRALRDACTDALRRMVR